MEIMKLENITLHGKPIKRTLAVDFVSLLFAHAL